MSLQIRQAELKDAAVLAELGGRTFYDAFIPFNKEEDIRKYIANTYTEEKLRANLQNPAILYFIAEQEGRAVGYTKLIRDVKVDGMPEEGVMEMEKIYVKKDLIGSGAGKLLMQRSIEAATSENFGWMFLGVWKENERALKFYKAFGWEIFGERSFKLGDRICEDHLLRLKLNP